MNTEPQTFIEAIRYFSDPDVCLDFMARLRWPNGDAVCPTCGRTDVRFISTRRIWECKAHTPSGNSPSRSAPSSRTAPSGSTSGLPPSG